MTNGAVDSSAPRLLAAVYLVANLTNATDGAVDFSAQMYKGGEVVMTMLLNCKIYDNLVATW